MLEYHLTQPEGALRAIVSNKLFHKDMLKMVDSSFHLLCLNYHNNN